MNILYLVSKDPRSYSGGNELRTHLLWEVLSKKGNVFTVVLNLKQKKLCVYDNKNICFVNPKICGWNLRKLLFKAINKLTSVPILPFCENEDLKIENFFPDVHFDLVVTRYIRPFRYFHPWKDFPTYVDIDDHPQEVFKSMTAFKIPLLFDLCVYLLNLQMRYVIKNIKGGWLSNMYHVRWCDKKIKHLPNIPIPPSNDYNFLSDRDHYLLTIGLMSYEPNYLGVDKFVSEVWPEFHIIHPEIEYVIGGKGAPEKYSKKWNSIDGVSYIGFVEDLEKVYEKCIAAVIPIYKGGGTCIKTIEALAYSRLCITTPFGCRGLPIEDTIPDNGFYKFKNTKDFIYSVDTILSSGINDGAERSAHRYVDQNYSLASFEKAVDSVLNMS